MNSSKLIIFKKHFLLVLLLVLSCPVFAADQRPWEQLNLSSAGIKGTTIYYEKSLESKLPFFENRYKQFLDVKERYKKIVNNKKQIVAYINKILGITEPDIEKQEKLLTGLLGAFSFEKSTFYIVLQDTTKFFLSEGGWLPNFTYNKNDNTVTYNPEFKTESEDGPVKHFELAFLVASEEAFEENINFIFQKLQHTLGGGIIGTAIHEVVESSLLNRTKPSDPYWRWFSDGFANAITIEILKEHAGFEIAEEFAEAYYISEYKQLEKEINLRYWMGLNFCIETPLEYENQLQMARYAYATQEAQRLIELHGIDCVRKIIDKVLTKETRTGRDIIQAIKEITGEDMQKRLDHYQTFETRQDGLTKYAGLFNAAVEKKDYEQMLTILLRTLELQESQLSPTGLQCYKEIATLLFKLGHEQAGDQAMKNCVELFKNSGMTMARDAAMETFIVYALSCKNARKAREIAEELLKGKPNHVLALTIQMVVHAEDGRISEAKKIAQKVIDLDKNEQSPSYRTAIQILATNAEHQNPDEEP
jgi:tetratricopeptide (TPR) repeat protein